MDLDSDVSQPASPSADGAPQEAPIGQATVDVVPLVRVRERPQVAAADEHAVNFKAFRSKARQQAKSQPVAHIVRVHDLSLSEAQLQHSRRVQRCACAAAKICC